jgi:hypothetical protein
LVSEPLAAILVCVGGFAATILNDLLEDAVGIEDIEGIEDIIELDFADIGTKGDADILTLLAFDADDAVDFTDGVPRGVELGVGTGVGVLLGAVDFELGTNGIEGTLETLEVDVSILL